MWLGGEETNLHKTQPISVQSSSHDFPAVLLAEITKVFRVNNVSSEAVCIDDSAPQQTIINPLLHLVCANVQRFRQSVFREPVLAHASAGSEPVQHSAH